MKKKKNGQIQTHHHNITVVSTAPSRSTSAGKETKTNPVEVVVYTSIMEINILLLLEHWVQKKCYFSFFLDKKQILTHTYGREIDCYRVEMYGMMNSSFCFLFTFFFASLNINFQHLVTQYFSL